MVRAHFEDIHLEILNQIAAAQSEISICVAWFTDFDIYKGIVEKQKEGIKIEIIVANHEFNKRSRVDFKEFLKYHGRVSYIGNISDGARDKLMHNKFCIIDNQTIITGSYNWTYKARMNEENILIIQDEPKVTEQFQLKFNAINPSFGLAVQNNKVTLLPIEKIMQKWEKKSSNPIPKPSEINQIFDKF